MTNNKLFLCFNFYKRNVALSHNTKYSYLYIFFVFLFLESSNCFAAKWTDQGNYDTSWYSDISTDYTISTAKELAGFAYLCNNGKNFLNKTVHLSQDIDLSKLEWDPIKKFEGKFDGNYFLIFNMKYSEYLDFGGKVGFFLEIGEKASVCNVKISSSSILLTSDYGGGIVGGVASINNGIIQDCIINCTVSGQFKGTTLTGASFYVGGVVGQNEGNIVNCVNEGDISSIPNSHGRSLNAYAGGIAAINNGKIYNCYNKGNIFSSVGFDSSHWNSIAGDYPCSFSGGIAGTSSGEIFNSYNIGNIQAKVVRLGLSDGTNGYAGAITGNKSSDNTCCYYSSAAMVEAPNIVNIGESLSSTQINNIDYSFTSLLNENIGQKAATFTMCYWAHSATTNSTPMHLNKFAFHTEVTDIGQSKADFKVIPYDIASSVITERGFEYKEKEENLYHRIKAADGFTHTQTNLAPETKYLQRAYIILNNDIFLYTDAIEFTTPPIIIKTEEAIEITTSSAIIRGEVQLGNTPVLSQGFLWKSENDDTYKTTYSNGDTFSYTLENLLPNTSYYYQAFVVTQNMESFYGDTKSFTTHDIELYLNEHPTVSQTSIEINGSINWNTNSDIIIEYKISTDKDYIAYKANTNGTDFNYELTDLIPNTLYICRAYTVYNGRYIYSDILHIKTNEIQVITLSPELDYSVIFKGYIYGVKSYEKGGFEYRESILPDIIPSKFVSATYNENTMITAEIRDVSNNIEYKYRAYYQNSEKFIYGEWVSFIPRNIDSAIKNIRNNSLVDVFVIGKKLIIKKHSENLIKIPLFNIEGKMIQVLILENEFNEFILPEGIYIINGYKILIK